MITQKITLIRTVKKILLFSLTLIVLSCNKDYNPDETVIEVSTLAGSTAGFEDGYRESAKFDYPTGVAVDASGNIYVADLHNFKIRKITPSGDVTTIAGSTQGFEDGANPKFDTPIDAIDTDGNIYVADLFNHKIRKINTSGSVSTLAGSTAGYADGVGSEAKFHNINGIAVDNDGNVYVTDHGNSKIRKITSQGVVTTLAGSITGFADGVGSEAKFNLLKGLAVDNNSNVYVADYNNHKIRKITPNGTVTTLAGSSNGDADGVGNTAQFSNPTDVAVDSNGNVYVADWNNNKIRKITPNGTVTTLAGTGTAGFANGEASTALFNKPYGITVNSNNTVYVAGPSNAKIRKIK